jgi:ABC-2 type transport system permease protein
MVNAFRYGMLGRSDIPLATAYSIILISVAVLFALAMILLKRGIGIRS